MNTVTHEPESNKSRRPAEPGDVYLSEEGRYWYVESGLRVVLLSNGTWNSFGNQPALDSFLAKKELITTPITITPKS